MAPQKLSQSDKQDILNLYRQVLEESTTTLASRYSVSTSTISRLLKQTLPEAEYEALIQQKRSGASRGQAQPEESLTIPGIAALVSPESFSEPEGFSEPKASNTSETLTHSEQPELAPEPAKSRAPIIRRNRQTVEEPIVESSLMAEGTLISAQLHVTTHTDESSEAPRFEKPVSKSLLLVSEEFADLDDEMDSDLDDDDDDDDLDDDDLDDELTDDLGSFGTIQVDSKGFVQVQPLVETAIPKICYVVVDRASELITRPLKDFAELGQIPSDEVQEKTLPIFDNHRIAKRFMRRMQRVVKVPDGRVFSKVRPYLQAKGITRLLIDGQVYSL
ncbi:MAG: transposase [Leptolyngbyaceae cyanobacterium CSU_1_4]|nr:transposase [Leptolyngbyaceae cyanobacterium CSU_1_4]